MENYRLWKRCTTCGEEILWNSPHSRGCPQSTAPTTTEPIDRPTPVDLVESGDNSPKLSQPIAGRVGNEHELL